jgi:Tfp pilus assembly PilM family ATPase
MKSLSELKKGLNRNPTDCTGIDFGQTEASVVRLRISAGEITVVGAEIVALNSGHVEISNRLRSRCGAIATSGSEAVVKLLTFPGSIDSSFEKQLPKSLGIGDGDDFRVSYRIISEGQGRSESRVLAVALPKSEATPIMRQFASGSPAPDSLEVAPLAALTAFESGPVDASASKPIGLVDFGTHITTLSIFNKGALVLVRRFDFGSKMVIERLATTLHVDAKTASGILADSAFDISELLTELLTPIASHMIVSRDFVERRENCTGIKLHAIGEIALSRAAMQCIERIVKIKIPVWDPFTGLTIAPQALDENAELHRGRFAAAIGAAIATLEAE